MKPIRSRLLRIQTEKNQLDLSGKRKQQILVCHVPFKKLMTEKGMETKVEYDYTRQVPRLTKQVCQQQRTKLQSKDLRQSFCLTRAKNKV